MTMLGESLLAIHEDGIPLEGIFSWCAYALHTRPLTQVC